MYAAPLSSCNELRHSSLPGLSAWKTECFGINSENCFLLFTPIFAVNQSRHIIPQLAAARATIIAVIARQNVPLPEIDQIVAARLQIDPPVFPFVEHAPQRTGRRTPRVTEVKQIDFAAFETAFFGGLRWGGCGSISFFDGNNTIHVRHSFRVLHKDAREIGPAGRQKSFRNNRFRRTPHIAVSTAYKTAISW